jgi:TPR repeat protein
VEPPRCDTACTKSAKECAAQGDALVDAKDPNDLACARRWLDDACERGVMSACNSLGYMLTLGKGGPEDRPRAQILEQRACDAKVYMGCINLASALESREPERALALYLDACDHGAYDGCWLAADRVSEGKGAPKDLARANELYDRACKRGISIACQRMPAVAR